MKKKEREEKMKGGLSALLGEAAEPQEKNVSEAVEQTRQEAIDKVEDAELREALLKHQRSNRGRPRKNAPHESRTDGYERITTIANIEKMEKLRTIALRETLTIKEVLEQCMDLAIEAYEKKNGKIRTRFTPSDGKGIFK